MCAHSKERLGWLDYFHVYSDLESLCIPPMETFPTAVRAWAFGVEGPEYFLIENRQRLGFDQGLAKEGLLIYHVDQDRYDAMKPTNTVNADEANKGIDPECADAFTADHVVNADDLDRRSNRADSLDVWCNGGNNNAFNAISIPDSRSKSGVPTPVAVANITACEGGAGGDIPLDYVCAQINVGAASPVDVCIEDCPEDDCNAIATCEYWWGSPDIWIDNDEDGESDPPFIGGENKLWTRVHNLGPDIAVGTTVQLYIAKGAMGLQWPSDASAYLGVTGIPVIEPGAVEEDYMIFHYPDLLELIGHFCIGAVIQQDEDPTYGESPPLSNNIAQINSQVLFVRGEDGLGGGDRSCPGPFYNRSLVYFHDGQNAAGAEIQVKIRVGSPPAFDDAIIPENWNLDFYPSDGPFWLWPGMKDSVFVLLSSDYAEHGESAHIPLTLWDITNNQPIGGMVQDYQIDCMWPSAPENGAAEWLDLRGDDLLGPNVEVEWDPVTLDANGNAEFLQYYEVYRADDQGNPFELIAEVAIDAEPDTVQFQFHDQVPRGLCPIVYTYQVRAIDGYGSAGLWSVPFELICPTVDLEEAQTQELSTGILGSFPNPASATTTIRYRVVGRGTVDLSIYSAGGERVRRLVSRNRSAGIQEIGWDGRDDRGRAMPSGV